MDITAVPRFEVLSDNKTGRVVVDVKVDGERHSFVHLSGPKDDAKEYFDGAITLEFVIPEPRSPAELGLSPDDRQLGIGLTSLHFVE